MANRALMSQSLAPSQPPSFQVRGGLPSVEQPDGPNSHQYEISGKSHSEGAAMFQDFARGSSGGQFAYASNFVVKKSTMVHNEYVYTGNSHERDYEVLSWQSHHILMESSFDSFRGSLSQCHEDTRITIKHEMRHWLRNGGHEKRLLWLSGPVGVGKTTIMKTIAEVESDGHLGATVFFSKSKPNYLERIFPTISYYLSLKEPAYTAYIGELRRTDPFYFQRTLEKQFEKLFVIPFSQRKILRNTQAWAILLDGLDECRGEAERNDREYERVQCTVIRLISTFVREHPSVPLVWIIASRPEHYLTTAFSPEDIDVSTIRQTVSIDSTEACQDVERYLRAELSNTVQQYPSHFAGSERWPSEEDISTIGRASSGLFIFAYLAVRFIQKSGNPVRSLAEVLSAIQKAGSLAHPQNVNPFAALDVMYTEILHRVSPVALEDTKRLLAAAFFKQPDYPLLRVCNVIGMERHSTYAALQDLHSVLDIPPPDLASQRNVVTFHHSFLGFLLNTDRSKDLGIEQARLTKAVGEYWHGYFRILQEAVSDGVSGITLAWQDGSPEENGNLRLSLLEEAQNCWTLSLTKIQSPRSGYFGLAGVPNFPFYGPISLLLDTLRQVDFSKLPEYFPQRRRSMPFDFFDSLRHLCKLFPEEVEQSGLVEHMPLESLNLGRVKLVGQQVFYRLEPDLPCERITWDRSRLVLLKESFASTPMMVWGRPDSRRGALFEITLSLEGSRGGERSGSSHKVGASQYAWEVYFLPYI
ncbi:hypothetical protein P691DRAFT_758714 [Macrolepiota fuliginosa MF-IS2]|uniref:NACHT domain-containing protein n=1 Tax=Macrolepiota fuliginosa MF-IS2 TaxID=1400762 RepID=A0A9P5XHE3_9AGAR|nr:hypothetical protein P691DRAFT_758714 [Macrolepiota fuliginosa MF-IS2]